MNENNKEITVTSPLLPNLDEFNEMLKQIWDSKWVTNNGRFHQQFEEALSEYLGVPYISLVDVCYHKSIYSNSHYLTCLSGCFLIC